MTLKSRKEFIAATATQIKFKNYSFAENILKSALVLFPNDFELIELLIATLKYGEKTEEISKLIRSTTNNKNCSYEHLYRYASHLFSIEDFNGSIILIKKILSKYGENFTTLYDLGLAQASNNQMDEALHSFLLAAKLNPNSAEVFYNIGLIFDKKNNQTQSLEYYKKAIDLSPDFLNAWINLAINFSEQNLFHKSKKAFETALQIDSGSRDAWFNLGILYKNFNQFEIAIDCLNKSIEIDKYFANAYAIKGDIFLILKKYADSIINYKKVIEINSEYPFVLGLYQHTKMLMCDWDNYEETVNKIREKIILNKPVSPPFPLISLFDNPQIQLLASENWARSNYFVANKVYNSKNTQGKIKVAYFSADFYSHATMHLLFDVLKHHNKNNFIIYGFNFSPIHDSITEEISKNLDFFFNVSDLSDKAISELATKEEIDIAVDLKGYTQNARPKIFSYGAAPIQINYLGYPGSLGSNSYTHIIADNVIIPFELEAFYTESVCRLPNCYQPNLDKKNIINHQHSLKTRFDYGLPNDVFIFCSFNSNYKITPEIFSSWIKILQNVPDSVFWCLVQSTGAQSNLLNSFKSNNIQPDRIFFCDPIDRKHHLERLRLADLFLDTYPCGGHTTASDSITAGLPILTIQGNTFASRVCASLLNAIQQQTLVADNYAEYEKIAINLASDTKYYSSLRENFINSAYTSDFFNASLYSAQLEKIYQKIIDKKNRPEGRS